MYTKTAEYYDALYHFKDYKAESQLLHNYILEHSKNAKSLLEIACGTGNYLNYFKEFYHVEGLDLNVEILKVAKQRYPTINFYEKNMVDFILPSTYDIVVCLFSSIAYVQTLENLFKTVKSMANHLKPGGFIAIEPWFSTETYWVNRITANFANFPELKISWMYKSEIDGLTSILNIHYMVGTTEGISNFTEKHVLGLWTDAEYREAFKQAGINTVNYNSIGLCGRGLYYGIKN
jgi:trans-aconitate methyltransferase